MRTTLPIVGLRNLSLIDFPGRLCSTLFTAVCNFRCPYCYNVDLVINPQEMKRIPEKKVLNLLENRGDSLTASASLEVSPQYTQTFYHSYRA